MLEWFSPRWGGSVAGGSAVYDTNPSLMFGVVFVFEGLSCYVNTRGREPPVHVHGWGGSVEALGEHQEVSTPHGDVPFAALVSKVVHECACWGGIFLSEKAGFLSSV